MKVLSSNKNVIFRQWLDLKESRGIRKHQAFLVSGRKTVPEVLAAYPERVQAVIQPHTPIPLRNVNSISEYQLTGELFRELDDFGTGFPILVVTLPEMESRLAAEPPEGPMVMCALGDPANVGALVRVALALGVKQMVLLEESASPYHPKAVRASSGTVLKMHFLKGPSVKVLAQDEKWLAHLVVLGQHGQDLGEYEWPKDFYLLIGEEGPGLPENLKSQKTLRIPIAQDVESLNAVSAASIALYASQLKRG